MPLNLSWQHAGLLEEKKAGHHFSIQQAQTKYKNERVEQERHRVISLLKQYDGNVSRVAREMGISRSTLYRKMKNLSF
jgi:transcriptional regulator with PAS, ATPase and Fis domain